jgi:hypothetical protein
LEIIDGKEDREPFLSQVLSTTTTFFRCLIFPTRWGDLLLRKAELEKSYTQDVWAVARNK